MSLARGFIHAGVPTIIMSLWAMEDHSGSKIVTLFYEYLSKGHNVDEALRNAKLDYLETSDNFSAHPYLWSAFVTIGDTEPLFINKRANIIKYSFVVLILLFAATIYYIKRIRS